MKVTEIITEANGVPSGQNTVTPSASISSSVKPTTTPRIIRNMSGSGKYAVLMPNGQLFSGFQDQAQAMNWMKQNISSTGKFIGAPGSTNPTSANTKTAPSSYPQGTKKQAYKALKNLEKAEKRSLPIKIDPTGTKVQTPTMGQQIKHAFGGQLPKGFDYLKDSPSEALEKMNFSKANQLKAKAKSGANAFIKSPTGRLLTVAGSATALLVPLIDWAYEMYAVEELYESGALNQFGDRAGEVRHQMAANQTRIGLQKALTGLTTVLIGLRASTYAYRLVMMAVPGVGWLSALSSTALTAAVFALLQTDWVQKQILKYIIEQMFPDFVGDYLFDISRILGISIGPLAGKAGKAMDASVNAIKNRYVGAAGGQGSGGGQGSKGSIRVVRDMSGKGKFAVQMPDGKLVPGFQTQDQADDWIKSNS